MQRFQAVVNQNVAAVAFRGVFLFVDYGVCAALVESLRRECVAVERRAFQREEERAFGAVAAVGRNHRMLGEDFVKFGYVHCHILYVVQR